MPSTVGYITKETRQRPLEEQIRNKHTVTERADSYGGEAQDCNNDFLRGDKLMH